MEFRKITGPLTISSGTDGSEKEYPLGVFGGGRLVKGVNYMVKVLAASSTTNVRIGLVLKHGPDGTCSVTHSTPISAGNPGTAFPALLSGDSDTTKMLGEVLMPILKIADSAITTQMTATVEVYEMRKPF